MRHTGAINVTMEDFPRSFAAAFAAQDASGLAALVAPDGCLQSLTGLWADTPETIESAFAAEAAGIFARARLVTGKSQFRPLGPDTGLLRQRFTVSGALEETGAELPRFAAMLIAVLELGPNGWQAVSLSFTALP